MQDVACFCGGVPRLGFPDAASEAVLDEAEIMVGGGLVFNAAGVSAQHSLKARRGESNADAFLCNHTLLGVADGVSSVAEDGVNPSHLPNELLARCEELWETRQKDSDAFDSETHATVRALKGDIETSASDVVEKGLLGRSFVGCKHLGATTCVLTFIFGEQLRIINIGDSMVLHLRRSELRRSSGEGKKRTLTSQTEDETLPSTGISSSRLDTTASPYFVLTSSTPQHHFFNCPYQLTRMYDVLMDDESLFRSVLSSADCFTSPARPGDIVILGSDGLFDNLFLSDILDLVSRHCHDRSSHGIPRCPPKVIATALLHAALDAAGPAPCNGTGSRPARADTFTRDWSLLCGNMKPRSPGYPQLPPTKGVTRPYATPFSKAAKEELGKQINGGKPDDTSVVVGFIVRGNNERSLGFSVPGIADEKAIELLHDGKRQPAAAQGATVTAAGSGRRGGALAAHQSVLVGVDPALADMKSCALRDAAADEGPFRKSAASCREGDIGIPSSPLSAVTPRKASAAKGSSASSRGPGAIESNRRQNSLNVRVPPLPIKTAKPALPPMGPLAKSRTQHKGRRGGDTRGGPFRPKKPANLSNHPTHSAAPPFMCPLTDGPADPAPPSTDSTIPVMQDLFLVTPRSPARDKQPPAVAAAARCMLPSSSSSSSSSSSGGRERGARVDRDPCLVLSESDLKDIYSSVREELDK
ncbi:unnamed protein product [Vitrella brassicaformis CCMP3155]|uniref:Protein phosphatase n=1 Tax=Vitrella brassicaformis (strain CCMP3155) TaxID=1169540 RepID=A0A0G4G2C0_VITBC|nr:unnamed protein product [Vitrella brassicaformis CCMP3155]|eukprot:CEM22327.1 unnamed protein product [Vitrella brassicaformis CCMP3155]